MRSPNGATFVLVGFCFVCFWFVVFGGARRWLPGTSQRSLTPRFISSRETRMTKYKLEYIWLDGYTPVPNLRGKTQLKEFASFPDLADLPLWGFDGSSTKQAEGHS